MLSTNGSYRVHKHRYHKQSYVINSHVPAKLDNAVKQHDNIMRYLVTRYPVTTASKLTPAYPHAMPTMQRYQAQVDNTQASNAAIHLHTGMDNAMQKNYELVPIIREPEGPASKIVAIATIVVVTFLVLKKMK